MTQKKFENINCLVIGSGSIGSRHAYNLKKLGIKNISIFDKNNSVSKKISESLKINHHPTFDSALSSNPDLCLVCTYPSTHIEIAKQCLKKNAHIFIEKPISSNIVNVNSLLTKAKQKKLKIGIGYNLRFDPGLLNIRKKIQLNSLGKIHTISVQWGNHIKNWQPGTDFHEHYILKEGGGIILDDSHEYDYLRWILDDEVDSVYCQTNKTSSFKTKSESSASIILRFKKGTITNLLLDYVRPNYERNCHIIGEKGSIKWENHSLTHSSWNKFNSRSFSKVVTTNLKNKTKTDLFKFKTNQLYIQELNHFLNSLISNEKFQDGFDALKTLKIGLAALESAKKNKVIHL